MSDLTQALERCDWLPYPRTLKYQRAGGYPQYLEDIKAIVAAARRVAEAPEVEWCEFHQAAGMPGLDCWGAGINGQDSCRMVRKLLVDPPKEKS